MTSIQMSFRDFVTDEGAVNAIEQLQGIQSSLETLIEVGAPDEKAAAGLLLQRVNLTLREIVRNGSSEGWQTDINGPGYVEK